MKKIALSFREQEKTPIQKLIIDRLARRFGRRTITLLPVIPIREAIALASLRDELRASAVLLVIIGPSWQTLSDPAGDQLLGDATDPVRLSIEIAIEQHIPIIPLYVENANLPDIALLPPSIRAINSYNGVPIHNDPYFDLDIGRVIKTIARERANFAQRSLLALRQWFFPRRPLLFRERLLRVITMLTCVALLVTALGATFATILQPSPPPKPAIPFAYTTTFYAVDMVSTSDVWAAGESGIIMHYANDHWLPDATTTTVQLRGIKMMSLDEGWAVGDSGVILHGIHNHWSLVTSPVNTDLTAIATIGQDVWVVGVKGAILHYANGIWHTVPSPTANDLAGISFFTPQDGLAVGNNGTMLHWNGTNWTSLPPVTTKDLTAVTAFNNGKLLVGWAVGRNGTLLLYNDSTHQWNAGTIPTVADLTGVGMGSDLNINIIGQSGTILYGSVTESIYSGNQVGYSWQFGVKKSPTLADLHAITEANDFSGWMVGSSGAIIRQSTQGLTLLNDAPDTDILSIALTAPDEGWGVGNGIYALHQGHWFRQPDLIDQYLTSIVMVSPTEGWAAGGAGTMIHYFHEGWALVKLLVTTDIYTLSAVSSADIWAVGSKGTILHYDGTNWTPMPTVTTADLRGIWMASNKEGWAVGKGGVILHYADQHWTLAASPTAADLTRIAMISATDGWIVGGAGTILHVVHGAWQQIASPVSQSLLGIFLLSANDGWIVGSTGTLLRFVHGQWQPQVNPITGDLRSITFAGATGWAGGSSGSLIKYVGDRWESAAPPLSTDLYDMAFLPDGQGWAIGDGTVLHFDGNAWEPLQALPDLPLRHIAAVAPNDLWVLGPGGYIYHFDGVRWKTADNPALGIELTGIAMLGSGDGWIIGAGGTILHDSNGSWQLVASPTKADLTGIVMVSSTEGWISGNGGTLLHYQNNVWSPVAIPTSDNLGCITKVSANEFWFCGTKTYRFLNGQWQVNGTNALGAIAMVSSTEGWGISGGSIYHYIQDDWVDAAGVIYPTQLHALVMTSATTGWAIGDASTILALNAGRWVHVPIHAPLPANVAIAPTPAPATCAQNDGSPAPTPVVAVPHYTGPLVFAGALNAIFYAWDPSSGTEIWHIATGGRIITSAVAAQGIVYVTAEDTYMYAFNAHNGNLIWRYRTCQRNSQPTVANGILYFGTENNLLVALNATTGAVVWVVQTLSCCGVTTPFVDNGAVYTSVGGYAVAYNPSTGAYIWRAKVGAALGDLVFADNTIFTGGDEVFAIDPYLWDTLHWQYKADAGFTPQVVVNQGVIYALTVKGSVIALGEKDGKLLWQRALSATATAGPVYADGYLFVGVDNKVTAVQAATGIAAWTYQTNGVVFAAPQVSQGIVYISSEDGSVAAVSAATGTLLWHDQIGAPLITQPTVSGG